VQRGAAEPSMRACRVLSAGDCAAHQVILVD